MVEWTIGDKMKILQDAIDGYFSKHNASEMPSCFEKESQFQSWLKLELEAPTQPRQFACRDCTSEYQAEMTKQGRCRIPGVPVAKIVR